MSIEFSVHIYLEALILIDEGVRIEQIDKALKNMGMPVGPVALTR